MLAHDGYPVFLRCRHRRPRRLRARGYTGIAPGADTRPAIRSMRRADGLGCDHVSRRSSRWGFCRPALRPTPERRGITCRARYRRSPRRRRHRAGRAAPRGRSGRPAPGTRSSAVGDLSRPDRGRRRHGPRVDTEWRGRGGRLRSNGFAFDRRDARRCRNLRHDPSSRRTRSRSRSRSRGGARSVASDLRRRGGWRRGDRLGRLRGRRRRLGHRRRGRLGRGRSGSRSRRRRRGRGSGRTGREQPERVDVSFTLRLDADTEVHGRDVMLRVAAPAHAPDRRALGHRVAFRDADGTEMDERHRVAVGGEDRDAPPVRRQGPGEAHGAGRRRPHGRALHSRDVDAAVLSRGVRVAAQRERTEHVAIRRPRPRPGGPAHYERRETRHRDYQKTMHEAPPSFSARATRKAKSSGAVGRRQSGGVSERR